MWFFYDEHDFYDGKTPLIYACEVRNFEVVNKLIQYGAEVSGLDSNGKTPLMYARDSGRQEVIDVISANKIFVGNGVDDLIDVNGYYYGRKSIINKSFELMSKKLQGRSGNIEMRRTGIDRDTLDDIIENFNILSKNSDINEACLKYQQNKTEENKQNLTEVIFKKVGLIRRNLQIKERLIGQFSSIRNTINGKERNVTELINLLMENDFGTYLSRALRTGLQNEFDWENAQQRIINEQIGNVINVFDNNQNHRRQ